MPQRVSVLLALALVLASSASFAQEHRFEITPVAGYSFGGGFNGGNYNIADQQFLDDLDVSNAFIYGLLANIALSNIVKVEFVFNRENTEVSLKDRQGEGATPLFDMAVNFYQVGLGFYAPLKPVTPFFNTTVGATRFSPEGDFESETGFSIAIAAGVVTFFHEHIGVRAQGQVRSSSVASGGDIFCDPQDLCFELENTIFMSQIDLTAGVVFAF